MAKAVRYHKQGGPEVLQIDDVAVGEPGAGQVRIRHTAVGVNFLDTYQRSGLYPMPLPSTAGNEGAGVIEAVGAGVTDLKAGDRVCYTGLVGAYCEQRLLPADRMVKLPAGISDEQAASMPRAVDGTRSSAASSSGASTTELLNIYKLSKTFAQDSGDVRVLTEVSLSLRTGETLGLVGESGSGKTTLAKNLLGITQPDAGSVITLNGTTLGATLRDRSPSEVGSVQIVFQNPDSALNRRHTVMRIVSRAIEKLAGKSRDEAEDTAQVLLNDMSVDPILHSVKPTQLSGGLKQRVAIARSFAGKPQLVVCDEPTSALDVSVQSQILNLLQRLRRELGLTYIFISHNLAVVEHVASEVSVMYLGRFVESAPTERLFARPEHPYTRALLASVLTPEPGLGVPDVGLGDTLPDPANIPPGCRFHPRCPSAEPRCSRETPPLRPRPEGGVECLLVP